jgi:hypothetical protein
VGRSPASGSGCSRQAEGSEETGERGRESIPQQVGPWACLVNRRAHSNRLSAIKMCSCCLHSAFDNNVDA